MIYVIHFASRFGHARHYIGWTPHAIMKRIAKHRSGRGSKLMRAVTASGIAWDVAAVYSGGRSEERLMKNRKKGHVFCPVCRDERGLPKLARAVLIPGVPYGSRGRCYTLPESLRRKDGVVQAE